MENTEKVYCFDRPLDNSALYAALANNNNDAMTAAMMNQNQWGNNPFAYLIWLVFAMRMWNNNGDNAQNSQLASIQSQMQDNQNSNLIMDAVKGNNAAINQLASNLNCDFNTLNGAVCDVRAAIDRVGGQVGFSAERVINAVNLGDCAITTAIKDCCCQTQQNIIKMGYENQLANCNQTNTIMNAISSVNTGLERGFSSVAYETKTQTCDLLNNQNANTQRIIDTLNAHWNQDLQQRYNDARLELSQLRQNATLIEALRPTTSTTTAA